MSHHDNTQNDPYRSQLDRIEEDIKFLRETVERLLGGMVAAQSAPGMQGMMARQMFPDMSGYTPVQGG